MKQDGLCKILLPNPDASLDQPPSYSCFLLFFFFFFYWQLSVVTATCFSCFSGRLKGASSPREVGEQNQEAWSLCCLYQVQDTLS